MTSNLATFLWTGLQVPCRQLHAYMKKKQHLNRSHQRLIHAANAFYDKKKPENKFSKKFINTYHFCFRQQITRHIHFRHVYAYLHTMHGIRCWI
jgi:hypothetical protein